MKTFVKLSVILIAALFITACSSSSDGNKSNSQTTYHGGETVDGYTLPPMPNPIQNDETLLGVDTNTNGIRDDVEIYIYNRFQGYTNSKVEREIAKQYGKVAQQTLISPETAYEDNKYELMNRAISCEYYYYRTYLKTDIRNVSYEEFSDYVGKHEVFNAEFQDVVFNTKDRIKAYFRYGASLSGHVFEGFYYTKDSCDFDPDLLIEGRL
jgi:uncharacterized protein YdbL (DUF1318 family)